MVDVRENDPLKVLYALFSHKSPEGFKPKIWRVRRDLNLVDPVRVLDLRVSLVRLRASAEASSAALPFQGIRFDAWLSYGPAEIVKLT